MGFIYLFLHPGAILINRDNHHDMSFKVLLHYY